MMPLLFILSFFIGFLIESMIGMGGTLIAYAVLLFFVDIKPLIVSTIIIPIFASFIILFSDIKSISWKVLLESVIICSVGVPIGIYLFDFLPDQLILKLLATFLIFFGIRSAFFGEITIGGVIGKIIVFISGIIHGLIGTGGPVAIIGMKDKLKTRANIRATMALFFIILNVSRIFQLSFTNPIHSFFQYYWLCVPVFFAIIMGQIINKKIPEKQFKKMLSIFFIIAGVLLMTR